LVTPDWDLKLHDNSTTAAGLSGTVATVHVSVPELVSGACPWPGSLTEMPQKRAAAKAAILPGKCSADGVISSLRMAAVFPRRTHQCSPCCGGWGLIGDC